MSEKNVHVWRAALDAPAEHVQAFAQTLSADEAARAATFREAQARRRFVVAHGVLRAILARYLNVAPACVRFVYGQHGKPYLAADFAASGIEFNLAHAGELAVVAVARTRAVGVDVEEVRPLPDLEAMARRYFSARETQALLALPAAQRHESFYRYWTRREAWLKARGDGLAGAWEGSDIARLERAQSNPPFGLRRLPLPHGYVGAVAAAGSDWHATHAELWFGAGTRHVVPLDYEDTRDPTIL